MSTSRKRRRGRTGRAVRAGAWVERTGGALLLWTWSVIAGVLTFAIGAIAGAMGAAWQWFGRCSGAIKIAIAIALGVLCVAMASGEDDEEDAETVWVSDDTEALARVIRSEIGVGTAQQRLHVAWATRNLAAERRQSVAEMACSPCGRQGPARPVSSRTAATEADRELARVVLEATPLLDPTGGASHFINPRLQDELARSGRVPGYLGQTYARVRARWQRQYGWEPYYRLGSDLELWGPARPRRRR